MPDIVGPDGSTIDQSVHYRGKLGRTSDDCAVLGADSM